MAAIPCSAGRRASARITQTENAKKKPGHQPRAGRANERQDGDSFLWTRTFAGEPSSYREHRTPKLLEN
jgi:hypothetical protein